MDPEEKKEVTVIEQSSPSKVIKTTKQVEPDVKIGPPQKIYEEKKTIFRFYQIIWYLLTIIELILAFRFFFKAFGADPKSGFVALIYAFTDPLSIPFQGIFPISVSGNFVIEWSILVAMVIYALLAYALVGFFQFIKPVSKEEVESSVDSK